jgi:sulfur-oxidizing protein SoxY
MGESMTISVLNRRAFLVTAAGCAAALPSLLAQAEEMPSPAMERTGQFKQLYKELLGSATPAEAMIVLDLPEIAENGNFVPVTISVDSPMTADEHVRTIHLLSTGNPVAKVATFHLSPLNGIARVQSRMRLARTQDVLVLAQMSTGAMAVATQTVKVTIGGCSN